MTPKEMLIQVKELLSDPARWTTGVLARDQNGLSVLPAGEAATCFCIVGAILKITPPTEDGAYKFCMSALRSTAKSAGRIAANNDNISHPELLAWIDRAIAEVRE